MDKYDVMTIGSCTEDIFLRPDEDSLVVPRSQQAHAYPLVCMGYGEKITIEETHRRIGGSACNVAVGLSRLGFKSSVVGALGKDSAANNVVQKLTQEHVEQTYLKYFKDIQTSFSVVINYKEERTILVYHGLQDYSLLNIPKSLKNNWLYIAPLGKGYQHIYKQAITLASEKNVSIAMNPGAIQIKENDQLFKSLLRVTKVLFVNKEEATDLLQIPGIILPKDLLAKLKALGPDVVVITDGAHGVYASDGVVNYHLPAAHAEVTDSTGAGDALSSGFLAVWLKTQDLALALKWGLMNATVVIEQWGAQTALMHKTEMKKTLMSCPALYKM